MFLVTVATLLGGGYVVTQYAPPFSDQLLDYFVVISRFFFIWVEVLMFLPVSVHFLANKGPKILKRFLLGLTVLWTVWITLFHLTYLLMVSLLVAWFVFCFTESHSATTAHFAGGGGPDVVPGDRSPSHGLPVFSNLYERVRRVPGGLFEGSVRSSKKSRDPRVHSGESSPDIVQRRLHDDMETPKPPLSVLEGDRSTVYMSTTTAPEKVTYHEGPLPVLPAPPRHLPSGSKGEGSSGH